MSHPTTPEVVLARSAPPGTAGGSPPPSPRRFFGLRGALWLPAFALAGLGLALGVPTDTPCADNSPPAGFVALFNGKDLSGWKVPEGDGGHWKVVEGVIDYDAESAAKGDKSLWSEAEFGDFVLQVDWRIKEAPFLRATGQNSVAAPAH